MSAPTKLLVIGDAGVNTGFERVIRGICSRLYDTGKYDITLRGIGYYDAEQSVRAYPWTVKPWGGDGGDPLGVLNFRYWLMEDQPDALLIVNDVWQITNFMAYKPKELPSVVYFPVDTPNIQWNHVLGAVAASECATFTRFGATEAAAGARHLVDVIKLMHPEPTLWAQPAAGFTLPHDEMALHFRADRLAHLQNVDSWNVVPHGQDAGIFRPMDKAEARAQFGLPQDAFVVLNVNTNQFRKRQDLTLRAFLKLARVNPKALLLLHCQGGDKGGWDLTNLIHYYGLAGRVILTHRAIGPDLTEEALVTLYNTADVQINTGGGEGWGLTSFEGAACGVPQLVPDWSATRELWREHGVLLEVSDWRHEPRPSNPAHAIIDVEAAGQTLVTLSQDPELLARLGTLSKQNAARVPSWDIVGDVFDSLIQRALHLPAPSGLSINDIVEGRIGTVQSELAGRVSLADHGGGTK